MLKRNRFLGKSRNQWVQEASQCQCKKIVFTQKMTIQGTHLRTDTDTVSLPESSKQDKEAY